MLGVPLIPHQSCIRHTSMLDVVTCNIPDWGSLAQDIDVNFHKRTS